VVGCWRGADLHVAQLMSLPLTVSCFSKVQIGFTFLVLPHLGSPGQRAVKRTCVCVCVCVWARARCAQYIRQVDEHPTYSPVRRWLACACVCMCMCVCVCVCVCVISSSSGCQQAAASDEVDCSISSDVVSSQVQLCHGVYANAD